MDIFLSSMIIMSKSNKKAYSRATYSIHQLEAKAYRALKQYLTVALQEYSISPVEWSLLGLLYENKKGLRLTTIADELGVEAPFITSLVHKLTQKKVIEQNVDVIDNRVKIILLTKEGKSFVVVVERNVKNKLKKFQQHISAQQFSVHLEVLTTFIENAKKLENGE